VTRPAPGTDLPPGIGKPATRAMLGAGVTRLDQVSEMSESDLRGLHGVGPKAIEILRRALADSGRSLRR
jgi:hypothetical protein